MDLVLLAIFAALFIGNVVWGRRATRHEEAALGHLRAATDAYKAARAEREEAYRVLSAVLEAGQPESDE